MTTEYRDKQGNVLRTDHGTQPAGRQRTATKKPAPKSPPAPASDAPAAPAKKEK